MGNTAWEHDWWEHCLVSTFWGHCLGALLELPLHKEHDLGVHVVLTNGIELVVLPRGPLGSMAAQLLNMSGQWTSVQSCSPKPHMPY